MADCDDHDDELHDLRPDETVAVSEAVVGVDPGQSVCVNEAGISGGSRARRLTPEGLMYHLNLKKQKRSTAMKKLNQEGRRFQQLLEEKQKSVAEASFSHWMSLAEHVFESHEELCSLMENDEELKAEEQAFVLVEKDLYDFRLEVETALQSLRGTDERESGRYSSCSSSTVHSSASAQLLAAKTKTAELKARRASAKKKSEVMKAKLELQLREEELQLEEELAIAAAREAAAIDATEDVLSYPVTTPSAAAPKSSAGAVALSGTAVGVTVSPDGAVVPTTGLLMTPPSAPGLPAAVTLTVPPSVGATQSLTATMTAPLTAAAPIAFPAANAAGMSTDFTPSPRKNAVQMPAVSSHHNVPPVSVFSSVFSPYPHVNGVTAHVNNVSTHNVCLNSVPIVSPVHNVTNVRGVSLCPDAPEFQPQVSGRFCWSCGQGRS